MPLTVPPSPIYIAGEPFPEWRPAGHSSMRTPSTSLIVVTMDDNWVNAFLGQLGQYIPGILEDGTAVEFFISTVQIRPDGKADVRLIPEVPR